MSLAVAAALALSATGTAASCSWDRPGIDPFMGNVPAAVDRYTDIPREVRERLKARMRERRYDEIATIRRDSISGRHRYDSQIRDMHFGQGRVCRTVTRERWAPDTVERGLVYCEAEHCILVPTVCRNVSRVTRLPGLPMAAAEGEGGLAPIGEAMRIDAAFVNEPLVAFTAFDAGDTSELVFEPPGAGEIALQAPLLLPLAGVLPGFGGAGGSGLSALEVPPGVAPIGSGSVGGGGVLPPASPPPLVTTPVPEVPEPGTWLMWAAGLAGLAWARRRARGRA